MYGLCTSLNTCQTSTGKVYLKTTIIWTQVELGVQAYLILLCFALQHFTDTVFFTN